MMAPMSAVGVIGLGNIGGGIARNVVADGHTTTVTDLDPERAKAIEGATAVGSVAEVAAASEITLTSLPNPTVVTAVAEEWASAAAPGSILLELSTTLPESNRTIASKLVASGHHFVEAPLTGGAIGAQNRGLVFMVGGDDEPVSRCLPLLDQLGRATFHVGPVGTGTTMKLANSLLAMACTWASFESLSLAAKAGIDLRTAVDVIRTAGVTNFYIDRGVEGINVRGKPAEFTLELAAKDAGLINEIAAATGVPAEIAQAARSLLDDAVARGLGDHDWTDLVLAAEARAGVDLHLPPVPAPAEKEG
jgi:3-hydroxyisobutyrate dehydrogenase-like beta-hydroxyacid dehydrogenase